MAAVAAGGEVQKNPKGREWAFARDVHLTEAGKQHPLYKGKPSQFDGFIMHLDIVTRIPEGGTLLASNAHSNVQALRSSTARARSGRRSIIPSTISTRWRASSSRAKSR